MTIADQKPSVASSEERLRGYPPEKVKIVYKPSLSK